MDKETVLKLVDLMCAVGVCRLKAAKWPADEALQIGKEFSDEIKSAIPGILLEELPQAAAGLDSAGRLTEEKLSIALTALAANRAVEIADKFIKRRLCACN